ncbi:gas vesicle protein [Nocardia higoensis]|uniref:Gas vesicle protein n=1 Tax=Nocardia higoensis TaxID=228599 RepID=A0ABS0DJR4_9NOCA|nr:gas vesicle protein GvpO [Nocardia higoensis]MBF6357827.1 gas vesicle protein [Nocardia higoensis]
MTREPAETDSGRADSPAGRAAASPVEAAAAASEQLRSLIAKQPEGTTSLEPTEDGWMVEIEVLEDRRIPSSADMLALYEVEIDLDGNLLAYRRTRRYSRGSADIGGRDRS